MSEKILIALSGGVDSAVAALLLKEQGYAVSAAYMRTWMDESDSGIFADCPWEEDMKSAKAVCQHLGIDFEVVNLIEQYREKIVSYLVEGYRIGTTPNPDIMCNREMKFGVFRQYALDQGFAGIATGHYCRKVTNADGSHDIWEGADKNKDQSYFLAMVKQSQLQNTHFPVGELPKPKVREIAEAHNIPNAKRKDSQGICFLGKVKIKDFLAQYIEDNPGEIIRQSTGAVVGEHTGLHNFTLGQRRGIGVPSNTDNKNYIVVSKDYETNQLIVDFEEAETPGLYQKEMTITDISWTNKPIQTKTTLLAKPRYRDLSQEITLIPTGKREAKVIFKEKQRALAKGQTLALYDAEKLLGGGYYL